jgi:hypothetical protein
MARTMATRLIVRLLVEHAGSDLQFRVDRQSSAHPVLHNGESRALQYAMRDRLTALGWREMEIIDDDLGRCFGKIGAVAAREVSRFARNSRDWQQLVEMCRVVDTVLVDQETVYAPRQGNDRLLLGSGGDPPGLRQGGRARQRTAGFMRMGSTCPPGRATAT